MRADLWTLPTREQAQAYAGRLIGSYPAAGKDDGIKIYVRQLVTAIAGFPLSILEQLVHPRIGVPGMIEGFPFPSLASVNKVADGLIERRAEELRRAEDALRDEEDRQAQIGATPEERERGFQVWQRIKRVAASRDIARAADHVGPEYFGVSKEEADRQKLEALGELNLGVESQNGGEDGNN